MVSHIISHLDIGNAGARISLGKDTDLLPFIGGRAFFNAPEYMEQLNSATH